MTRQQHTVLALTLAMAWAACGPTGGQPTLQPIPDQVVAVGEEIVITVAASDMEGEELGYNFATDIDDIRVRANPARITRLTNGTAQFRWTPLASDVGVHPFDFTVTDGRFRVTDTIQIDVRSAVGRNSAPRFIRPAGTGTTIDLASDPCASLEVEVVDSDSSEIRVAQEEPAIEHAELKDTSSQTATWRWCPSPEQQAADDRYLLTLSASDGDHPKVVHPYLIVLRKILKPDCPGEAPVITHTPQDAESLVNLTVAALVADDSGLKEEPLLYVATQQPAEPFDLTTNGPFVQHTMHLTDGDTRNGTWTADIPNPVASEPSGTAKKLYYLIVAQDDDDDEGDCDHLTEHPATGVFEMIVTNPGGAGGDGLCEPCTADIQCGGVPDLCVRVGQANEPFCLEGCAGASCPDDFECSPEPIESVDGTLARQCVPVSNNCADPGGQVCLDDEFEDNDSREEAQLRATLPAGARSAISCPAQSGFGDDEDFYAIELSGDAQIELDLVGGAISDLDLALFDASGTPLAISESLTSGERITGCLQAGNYTVRVYAFGTQRNPYTLTYTPTAASCSQPTVCVADDNENDDNAGSARSTSISPAPHVSTDQTVCTGDQDWYQASLSAGQTVTVDLTFTHSVGDLDLYVVDPDGATVLTPCCNTTNGQSATDNEHVEFTVPSNGVYFIVVDGFQGASNLYDISIGVQ